MIEMFQVKSYRVISKASIQLMIQNLYKDRKEESQD